MEDGWYFTGREVAVDEITHAVRSRQARADRYFVVAGPPGAGKSALLARLPVLADRRLSQFAARTYDDISLPGVRVFPIYLRQRTQVEFVDKLREVFGGRFTSVDGLLDHLNGDPDHRSSRKILVLDGLDEAADETARLRIARDVRRLGASGALLDLTVVVSCRAGHEGSENARLIETLGTRCTRIDVDSSKYVSRDDFRSFVERRLLNEEDGASPYRGQDEKVAAIAQQVTAAAFPIYLVAQLVTRSLIDEPELSEHDLRSKKFPSTVREAFDDYIARFESDETRARDLMSGLAHARGTGFTRGELWLRITHTVTGVRYGMGDLDWLLKSAAAFLIESVSVKDAPRYRLYHQALVDMLLGERGSEVYDECLQAAQESNAPDDIAYLRSHLSGHALAAGRLSELLVSPEALLHCSIGAALRDSSRNDVVLPDDARRARSALRSVERLIDHGSEGERAAYLAMAGHQFGLPQLANIEPRGNWAIRAAAWRASSEHVVLARGRPYTKIAYGAFDDDDFVLAGDADGTVSFEMMDGSGSALQTLNFPGAITDLAASTDDRQMLIAAATDSGEVHLVQIKPRGIRRVRAVRFDVPVAGLSLAIDDHGNARLLAAAVDGSLVLQTRRGVRLISRAESNVGERLSAIVPLRGGRSLAAVLTPNNQLGLIRLDDLAVTDGILVSAGGSVYQIFDSWYSPDQESSVIYSSDTGISELGLEFGGIETLVKHEASGRFITALSGTPAARFVLTEGTNIICYDQEGRETTRLRGHEDFIVDLVVADTSVGSSLCSVAEDGSLRLWTASASAKGPSAAHDSQPRQMMDPAVWGYPFGLVFVDGDVAKLVTAGKSIDLPGKARAVDFDQTGQIVVRRREHWQIVSTTAWRPLQLGDASEAHTSDLTAATRPVNHWDEDGIDEWTSLSWARDGRQFLLSVAESSLQIGEIDELEIVHWTHFAKGVSDRASSPDAITSCVGMGRLFLFIADGSAVRIYDDHLNLIVKIRVSGGPASKLKVHSIDFDGNTHVAFALICESGLIAGEVIL